MGVPSHGMTQWVHADAEGTGRPDRAGWVICGAQRRPSQQGWAQGEDPSSAAGGREGGKVGGAPGEGWGAVGQRMVADPGDGYWGPGAEPGGRPMAWGLTYRSKQGEGWSGSVPGAGSRPSRPLPPENQRKDWCWREGWGQSR